MEAENVKEAQIVKELDKKMKASIKSRGSVSSDSSPTGSKLNSPVNKERRLTILKFNIKSSKEVNEEFASLPQKIKTQMP